MHCNPELHERDSACALSCCARWLAAAVALQAALHTAVLCPCCREAITPPHWGLEVGACGAPVCRQRQNTAQGWFVGGSAANACASCVGCWAAARQVCVHVWEAVVLLLAACLCFPLGCDQGWFCFSEAVHSFPQRFLRGVGGSFIVACPVRGGLAQCIVRWLKDGRSG